MVVMNRPQFELLGQQQQIFYFEVELLEHEVDFVQLKCVSPEVVLTVFDERQEVMVVVLQLEQLHVLFVLVDLDPQMAQLLNRRHPLNDVIQSLGCHFCILQL